MRPLTIALIGAALATAAPAPAASKCAALPAGWSPQVAAARQWAQHRRGHVSFAVRTDRRLYGWRTRRDVPTASVLKVMLMTAYLNRASVRARALRPRDHALLDPMIRRSDNLAAQRVLEIVGASGLYRLARRVGMQHFRFRSYWGHSTTDAADQTRLMLNLERSVAPRHRATALRLLRTIVPAQRWGIGRLRLPGWRVYFKGGWGDGTGRVDHQVVLLRGCGATRVAVAVMTTSDGTHRYGQRTLEGVFRRLLGGLFAQ